MTASIRQRHNLKCDLNLSKSPPYPAPAALINHNQSDQQDPFFCTCFCYHDAKSSTENIACKHTETCTIHGPGQHATIPNSAVSAPKPTTEVFPCEVLPNSPHTRFAHHEPKRPRLAAGWLFSTRTHTIILPRSTSSTVMPADETHGKHVPYFIWRLVNRFQPVPNTYRQASLHVVKSCCTSGYIKCDHVRAGCCKRTASRWHLLR